MRGNSLVRVVLAISIVAAVPSASAAQAPAQVRKQQIPLADYAARRAELTRGIDSGVVVAFGAAEPTVNWPNFYQSPGFQYLTGFAESDAILVMVKRNGATTSTMFVPATSRIEQRWNGIRTDASAMQSKIGIQGRAIAGFKPLIDSLAQRKLPFYVVPDYLGQDYAGSDSLTRGVRFVTNLRAANPGIVTTSLDSTVRRMRAKKSPVEMALIRQAAAISSRGHREAMKTLAPGCGENEIQAVLDGTFRRLGGDRPGYGSIVAGGKNALILHYQDDNDVLNAGDLLLIDAAASFDHYTADVTRTMPVSGRFTPAQREIYQLVRDAQEAYVKQIRAGVSARPADSAGRSIIAAGLTRFGLVDSATATFDGPPGQCPPNGCSQLFLYALHGYGGHGIGLDVHDPAQYARRGGTFEVGDVFSVEPGIYVSPEDIDMLPDTPRNRAFKAKVRPALEKYKYIGVRIEDNYAITESGVENLSVGAPREIGEIEALMRQPRSELPGGGRCGTAGAR